LYIVYHIIYAFKKSWYNQPWYWAPETQLTPKI
jgi:hypothetical protein